MAQHGPDDVINCSSRNLLVPAGLFDMGLAYGGPGSLLWGWIIVSFFTCFLALSMSEISSSLPTAGGIYYWAHMLSGPYGPFAAWLTAHVNFIGQVLTYPVVNCQGWFWICACAVGMHAAWFGSSNTGSQQAHPSRLRLS